MNVPTDRRLIVRFAATGFGVVLGGWAGGLVHAEATDLEETGRRVAIGAVFVLVLFAIWYQFREGDCRQTLLNPEPGWPSMAEPVHLERAREQLSQASDVADPPIQTQLDSIEEGLFEDLDGVRTQDEPGPKVDHVFEIERKLEELRAEAKTRRRKHLSRRRGNTPSRT